MAEVVVQKSYYLHVEQNDNDKIIYIAPFPGAQWRFTIYSVYITKSNISNLHLAKELD